jgi:hypothetical protein
MRHLFRGEEVGGDCDIAAENFCLNMFLRSFAKAACSGILMQLRRDDVQRSSYAASRRRRAARRCYIIMLKTLLYTLKARNYSFCSSLTN